MSDLIKLAQLYKANKYEMGYIDVYENYFKDIKDKKLKNFFLNYFNFI